MVLSLGDQFVARALALLNDTLTVKIVNTIKGYICNNENSIELILMKCSECGCLVFNYNERLENRM